MMRALLKTLISYLLPPTCLQCREQLGDEGALCSECWKEINFISHPYCNDCGIPFEYEQGQGQVCEICLKHPPLLSKSRAAIVYNDRSKSIVMKLKYGDATYLAQEGGRWMARYGQDCLKGADVLIPVPLHRWRLFSRRYNQATLLARSVSKHSQVPFLINGLIRIRRTPPQGHRSLLERRRNVSKAFVLRTQAESSVTGKCCVLIDDVKTTSATLNECARVLLAHGAKEVRALTLAMVRPDERKNRLD